VSELWIAFYRKDAGKRGLTYDEAVEEALCFGWIDGLKQKHDAESFRQRFTPRRPTSIWSAINIRRVAKLRAAGLMAQPGLAAFESRDPKRAGLYSFENRDVQLDSAAQRAFRATPDAWAFFSAQPPGYRRIASFWVMNAKRAQTRERRLAQLIADSKRGERIAMLRPAPASKGPADA
jgi:uncharacterized protein YdeI (YjbR/CyaY-like superfamily)